MSTGKGYNKVYTFYPPDPKSKDDVRSKKICREYVRNDIKATTLNYIVKYSLIIVNTIIRYVVIYSIDWVGCDDESNKMQHTTNIIFICQFFNTAIIFLVCNANLHGQGFLAKIFSSGTDTDFNQNWFQAFGDTLIGAMIFGIYYPFIGEGIWGGLRILKRIIDTYRGSDNDGKTACITQQLYINTYCGPDFYMHYKYSAMLNTSFVTMMYGGGLPILFPVACLQFIVFYMLENYKFYYVYKQPPAYDEKLNTYALNML